MFNFFKKKPRVFPPFNKLKQSPIKYKYFIRISQWDWLNQNMIHVFDSKSARMITMDPWPQIIFLESDGQKTISEFVHSMASNYSRKEGIPEELDDTILSTIDSLMKEGLIELIDAPKKLPYQIELPIQSQDSGK